MKKCSQCNGKGEVPCYSRYAADANGRFSTSGENIASAATSICGQCLGMGFKR